MVGVLHRRIFRTLRQSWGLLLAIGAIMSTGVACYVALGSTFANLSEAKHSYYRQCRLADFWVDVESFPHSDLTFLREVPGVAEVRPRIQSYMTVDIPDVPKPVNALALSLPAQRRDIINNIHLLQGSYFTGERANEVIVEDTFADHHHIQPGDELYVVFSGRRRRLLVVGRAISSEFVFLVDRDRFAPNPDHFGVLYLQDSYLQEALGLHESCNQIVGQLVAPLREHADAVLRAVESRLKPNGVTTVTPLKYHASHRYLTDDIHGLGVFATVLPTIFVATSAIVLNIMMVRLIERDRPIIGTLKALGYGDGQLFFYYMKLGALVGVFSGVIGWVLGFWLAEWLTDIFREYFAFPDLSNRFHPYVFAVGCGISLLCAIAGTIRGAYQVLRLNAAEAMRPKSPKYGTVVALQRFSFLWERLALTSRLALRACLRNWFRSAAGIFAAAMGTSLVFCALTVDASILYLIDFEFRKVQLSDLDVTFKGDRDMEALSALRRLPAVTRAEPVLDVPCTLRNGPYQRLGTLTGLASGAHLTVPHDTHGQHVRIPETGLVMTRKLAEMLHVRQGQEIVVQPVRQDRRELSVPVVQIFESHLGLPVYGNMNYVRSLVESPTAISGAQLGLGRDPVSEAALYRRLKSLSVLQSVDERAGRLKNLEKTLVSTIRVESGVLILFGAIVLFASILNGSLISLSERQREVGLMWVLGYSDREIGGVFLEETFLVNTVGMLLGLPMGYFLASLISGLYDTELVRLPLHCPPQVWIWSAALSTMFTLGAHAVVHIAIRRTRWREAIATKE